MITIGDVTACLVTRGDVDMQPILKSLGPFREVSVWDNGVRENQIVWGRYVSMGGVDGVVYTQDDDVILPPESLALLVAAYQPGRIVCNVPARFRARYTDSGLVGFGAVFDPYLVASAVREYEDAGGDPRSDEFKRTCDIVVTMLNEIDMVDLPYEELPYAHDDTRMWKQTGHFEERQSMRRFCREIRARRERVA
jgi:hypothetical protein